MLRSSFNFIIYAISLINSPIKSAQTNILIGQILNFEPYQIIVFTSSAEILPVENDILQKVASRSPILKYNLKSFHSKNGCDEFLGISSWIKRPRKSSLLLIFGQVNNFNNIREILKFWIKFSPIIMRPKCLIIFNNLFVSKNDLLSLLNDAWSVSFLDITIVNFNSKNDTIEMHNYNPFVNTYSSNNLISTTHIFPDKLTNLKGFTIKVPYVDIVPDMSKCELHNNRLYSGTRFAVTTFLSSVLNFKIDVLDDMNSSTEWAFAQLKYSKVDMTPIPLFATDKRIRGEYQIGKAFSFDQNCGLTVINNTVEMRISFSTFLQLSLSIFCIFLLTYIVYRLILNKKNLSVLTSIRLLLGQAGAIQPRKHAERILFICVSILSIIYSPTITAKVMSLVVQYKETRIDSLKDIIKSDLQPYTYSDLIENIYNDDDKYTELVKSRIFGLDTMRKCIDLLKRKEKVICILPERQAKFLQELLHRQYHEEFLTITDLKFTQWEECYFFSSGSPYSEKFDQIIQRMLESGLPNTRDFSTPTSNSHRWIEIDNWFALVQYLVFYLIGCILSIICFFVELLVAYLNKE